VWLVAGDTFGRRAASGFAAGAVSRVAKLAEGRLSSSPLFSKARNDDEGLMAEGLEALLRSAQAALSASSATLPSAEERCAEAAMAESLAASGAGAVAKTAV